MSDQSASQIGHHNIIVQTHGDNARVDIGSPHLKLIPVEARVRAAIRTDIDILNPSFQAVPLVGRDEDLKFLHDWLNAEKRIAITAIIGSGGSGKTRLSLEFLQRLPPGWQGGFLTSDEAKRFVSQENLSEWSWQRPTLIIADYAALFSEALCRWFTELSDHIAPAHPLRILLLERHGDIDSGWYHSLADATWHGQRVRELFWPTVPRQLSRLDSPGHRREVLQSGLNAAASIASDHLVPSMPTYGEDKWFDQRLSASYWGDPLLLLMAGMIALTDGFNAALSLSRPDLAKRLATRERDRIRKSVGSQVAKDLIAHLYACATLCGGLSYDDALQVSEAEFIGLHRQYPGGAGQAVEDLANVLGSHGGLSALAPDLLGEALLIITLGSKGAEVTERLSHISPAEVAASLVRSTQDFAPFGESWPLEWLMALIGTGLSDPEVLLNIELALPSHSLALGESALLVTSMLVRFFDACIRRSGVPSSGELSMLADLLDRLSVRQHEVGRRSESLASAQESVRIWRSLADANIKFYLPKLASSLTNLAHSQGISGHRIEALESISEAVRIDRVLAEEDPEEHLPTLSSSLGSQSLRYSETGRVGDALSAITECVNIRRALVVIDPERFLPDLAMALNTQANHLTATGNGAEALVSTSEAVSIYRSLAEAKPDAYLVEFARSLNSHGAILGALGRDSEALEFIAQAVDIRRLLAEGNPDAFLPDLGRSLMNFGLILSKMGRHKEAATLLAEAVRCYRDSIDNDEDPVLPWLAKGLHCLAKEQLSLEQHPEALAAVAEASQLLRTLTKKYPDMFLQELADLLLEQASIEREMLLHAEALVSFSELVDICRKLARIKPNDFLSNLASALLEQAVTQITIRRNSDALPVLSEVVEIYRDLGMVEPGSFLPDLANALHLLSKLQYWAGEKQEALISTEEAVRTVRRFAEKDAVPYYHDLGLSLNTQAIQQAEMGKFDDALLSITEAVQLWRCAVKHDPEQFLADLAASLNNQAGIHVSLEQHALARTSSVEAIQHYRTAVQRDRADLLPDLASALSVLGDCSEALGLLDEARNAASECLCLLAPLLSDQKRAYKNLAKGTFAEYKTRSQRLGLPLDDKIVRVFERLGGSQENSDG